MKLTELIEQEMKRRYLGKTVATNDGSSDPFVVKWVQVSDHWDGMEICLWNHTAEEITHSPADTLRSTSFYSHQPLPEVLSTTLADALALDPTPQPWLKRTLDAAKASRAARFGFGHNRATDGDITAEITADPVATRLLETVADIAHIAGIRRYYSGDSRKDVQTFVLWAREFDATRTVLPDGTEHYPSPNGQHDYMSAVETFTDAKLTA